MINGLTALSLLLCVGITIVWVRSKFVGDSIWGTHQVGGVYYRPRANGGRAPLYRWKHYSANSQDGELIMSWEETFILEPESPYQPNQHMSHKDIPHLAEALCGVRPINWHFFLGHFEPLRKTISTRSVLAIRWWVLDALTALLPAVWLVQWGRRWYLRRLGGCSKCHYDLTGNVSGVCPECGRKIAEAK
jgi:hypothetical protein